MTRTEEPTWRCLEFSVFFICFSVMGNYYISKLTVKESQLNCIIAGVDMFNISNGTTLSSLKYPSLLCLQSETVEKMFTAFCFFLALRTSCLYNDPELSSMEKE